MLQKRGQGWCLRSSDPVQLPSLLLCSHPLLYHRPQLNQTDVPESRTPPLENAPVCESTPWPGTGKMSGNLFEDSNWLLPPNYLDKENKNEHKNVTGITSPRPPMKEEEPKINEQSADKVWMGTRLPLL